MIHKEEKRYLDAGEAKETRLLFFKIFVDLVRVVAINVRFLHKRECNTMVALTELGNVIVRAWFLATKLLRK